MNIFFIPFLFSLIFNKPVEKRTINIYTLGDVNKTYVITVKNSIEQFYGFQCVIKNKLEFTNDILTKSKTRYEAYNIIKKYNTKKNTLILTEKDIATKMKKSDEYGIIGLGFLSGNTCVISTYRLKRDVPVTKVHERLSKVSLHELGHNLGLNHCDKNPNCLMNDAKGSVKQIDKEKLFLCGFCKKKITPVLKS